MQTQLDGRANILISIRCRQVDPFCWVSIPIGWNEDTGQESSLRSGFSWFRQQRSMTLEWEGWVPTLPWTTSIAQLGHVLIGAFNSNTGTFQHRVHCEPWRGWFPASSSPLLAIHRTLSDLLSFTPVQVLRWHLHNPLSSDRNIQEVPGSLDP